MADVKALIGARRFTEARERATTAARRYPDDLRFPDVLVGLLRYDDEVDAALELAVHNAQRHCTQLRASRTPRREERPLEPHERVLTSGYFYSGSSAVLDFLTDHEGCIKWSPAGEMRLIKFPGGLDALAEEHARDGDLSPEALVDLYLHLTGRRVETTPKGTYDRWRMVNRNSRRLHRMTAAQGYLLRCYEHYLELVDRARTGSLTAEELESRLRTWVTAALDAAAADTGADRLIVDQAVTAWRLPIARFLPPSTFVVVHRDPRDQFVEGTSVLDRPGRSAPPAWRFAASYWKRRRRVRKAIPDLERRYGHRFLTTAFEDFVADHEQVSGWLLHELGMESVARDGTGFDPEASRQNIGKHRSELGRWERLTLGVLLWPYLDSRATQAGDPDP